MYRSLSPLNESYFAWQEGSLSYQQLRDEILIHSYLFAKSQLGMSEDQSSDFFLSMQPYWQSILSGFAYRGIPFAAYIAKVLQLRSNAFLHQEKLKDNMRSEAFQIFLWAEGSTEEKTINLEELAQHESSPLLTLVAHPWMSRHPLYCRISVLLAHYIIEEQELPLLAHACATDIKQLKHWISQLQAQLIPIYQRRNKLEEKLTNYLTKLIHLQKELRINDQDRADILLKIAHIEARRKECIEKLERLNPRPTHKHISRVLEVPVGSVSYAIHNMRKHLKKEDIFL